MGESLVKSVAVIGAGISGVVSAAHLLAAGLEVTVFERNKAAGGVWLFDERKPIEPLYPSIKPSEADRLGDDPRKEERKTLEHAPPGPCYEGLSNNVSTPLMRVKLNAWPEGTPDFVSHKIMKEYIQDTSRKTGVEQVTIYGACVSRIQKNTSGWEVTWSTLHEDPQTGKLEEKEATSAFDAVVVGSGHYHAPRIPDIPGLSEAKARWPSQILHSKGYRKPENLDGKNVLLIGGGVSSSDIARELGPVAQDIYQSTRSGEFDLPSNLLPENGLRIGEIASFEILPEAETPLADNGPLPIKIHLKSGETLCGVDQVFICTGYHITLPFLRDFHEDGTRPADASDTVLVTDGSQVHNLYKDIFYIPDPTLVFVGIPYYTATFTLFEFQAIVVTAVFAGVAKLPPRESMKEEYREKLRQKGCGRGFHSLKNVEESYVKDILGWINSDRESLGLAPVEGHTAAWKSAKEAQRAKLAVIFGSSEKSALQVATLPVCA
ncbi:hypothetical protein ASPZODRAFT_145266 [Penicilliopsis zonata CBS 506.65]|uniref:FAD dependent oxidoreductase domain-containing protein n=1 Tax=Penicilliopsis zonata CBS 506.65 TaxID=1073090 RepID=A0A1L9SAE7_9EURO|nr:hypothetical protein ASPZODRAFT_145266 [Penicilliopsis zonata CBS 506.65]OJJ44153.1 hypothetical protein ASPZODRAFT_145266 [Penicilliopsis zonata CBS 506.65]